MITALSSGSDNSSCFGSELEGVSSLLRFSVDEISRRCIGRVLVIFLLLQKTADPLRSFGKLLNDLGFYLCIAQTKRVLSIITVRNGKIDNDVSALGVLKGAVLLEDTSK